MLLFIYRPSFGAAFFVPGVGRYPHPRICRKFTREGGAVSARHTQGSDHPLPGTPRPGGGKTHQPGGLCQSKVGNTQRLGGISSEQSEEAPPGLHQSKVEKSCGWVDFSRAKWRSVPSAGLSQSKVGKCARWALLHGKAQKRFSGRRRQKTARPAKKNRVFFRPLRACIRKRGLLFPKKKS